MEILDQPLQQEERPSTLWSVLGVFRLLMSIVVIYISIQRILSMPEDSDLINPSYSIKILMVQLLYSYAAVYHFRRSWVEIRRKKVLLRGVFRTLVRFGFTSYIFISFGLSIWEIVSKGIFGKNTIFIVSISALLFWGLIWLGDLYLLVKGKNAESNA